MIISYMRVYLYICVSHKHLDTQIRNARLSIERYTNTISFFEKPATSLSEEIIYNNVIFLSEHDIICTVYIYLYT